MDKTKQGWSERFDEEFWTYEIPRLEDFMYEDIKEFISQELEAQKKRLVPTEGEIRDLVYDNIYWEEVGCNATKSFKNIAKAIHIYMQEKGGE